MECSFGFREYYHDGHLSHTIPKDANLIRERRKIIILLKRHNNIMTEEIADALNIGIKEVLDALAILKENGKIELMGEGRSE
jgi:predicted ArsR family transcriptional regulator